MIDAIIARPRGVGVGSGISLVTGEPVSCGPDLSMFVESRADAYRLVDWVTPMELPEGERKRVDRVFVDYRSYEPRWLQAKLVVEIEHREVLERLHDALVLRDGYLDAKLIQWALDPGYNWDTAQGYQHLYPEKMEAIRAG